MSTAFNNAHVGLLSGLFERAAPNLSQDELSAIAGRAEDATSLVRQVADLCEGLGCLVADDEGPGSIGSFRDTGALTNLLFLVSNMASHAASVMEVAQNARGLLDLQLTRAAEKKAKGGRS